MSEAFVKGKTQVTASPGSAMSFPLVGALDVPGSAADCHGGYDLPRAASDNQGPARPRKARVRLLFRHQRPYRLIPEFIVDTDAKDIVAETDRFRDARYDVKEVRRAEVHIEIFELESPIGSENGLKSRS